MALEMDSLLSVSSDAIALPTFDKEGMRTYLKPWGQIGSELGDLLVQKNGFWTFESSLLVRPFFNSGHPLGLVEWNDKQLWKSSYSISLSEILFFAEDAFGCQFCIHDGVINTFDPETTQMDVLARSLADWSRIVVEDYQLRSGYPLAHSWQTTNHPLRPGFRLLPSVPFVLGGKYEADSLHEIAEVEGMLFRASIANQIQNVPDGGQVVIELINKK